MYDSRLNLCRQVAEDATEYFGPKVFGTPIPRNVRLAEAPSFGKPILLYDMQSVGAKSYLAVGQELLRRVEGADAVVMPAAGVAPAAPPGEARLNGTRAPEARVVETGTDERQGTDRQGAETQGVETQVAEREDAEGELAESETSPESIQRAESSELDEAGESSKPPSEPLPEVTT
jgi:hypothetical protein